MKDLRDLKGLMIGQVESVRAQREDQAARAERLVREGEAERQTLGEVSGPSTLLPVHRDLTLNHLYFGSRFTSL